jgi:hypothetical protein
LLFTTALLVLYYETDLDLFHALRNVVLVSIRIRRRLRYATCHFFFKKGKSPECLKKKWVKELAKI